MSNGKCLRSLLLSARPLPVVSCEIENAPSDTSSPPFVTAFQQELGLKLEGTTGEASALVIDRAEKPAAD